MCSLFPSSDGASNLLLTRELTWTCTHQQITLLPTSIEGLSIPPALLFTKDQTKERKVIVVAPPDPVTIITTVIPLVMIITVVNQAMITFDHISVRIPPS